MNRLKFAIFVALTSVALPALAATKTVVSAQLSAAERSQLATSIAAYRSSHASAFAAVAAVRGCSFDGYRNNRNPVPECGRELRALGPDVLLPMLDLLISGAPKEMAQSAKEQRSLTISLCQAVGVLRAPLAMPVLRAVLETATDSGMQRAAAEGLGRHCGQDELQQLTQRSGAGDALEAAAIAGLGVCKRPAAAEHLAAQLAQRPAEQRAANLAHALGIAASSWSWRALGAARAADAMAARTAAARALAPAFFAYQGEVRKAVREALQMAEHPDTTMLLQQAAQQANADAATTAEALRLAQGIAKRSR